MCFSASSSEPAIASTRKPESPFHVLLKSNFFFLFLWSPLPAIKASVASKVIAIATGILNPFKPSTNSWGGSEILTKTALVIRIRIRKEIIRPDKKLDKKRVRSLPKKSSFQTALVVPSDSKNDDEISKNKITKAIRCKLRANSLGSKRPKNQSDSCRPSKIKSQR